MKYKIKFDPNLTTKQNEINSLLNEASFRFVDTIRGIERLMGVTVSGFETMVHKHHGKEYAVYFDNLGDSDVSNKEG